MGLCSSTDARYDAHNEKQKKNSAAARKDLKHYKQIDMARTKPIFDRIGLEPKIQKKMYKEYEQICEGGLGNLDSFLIYNKINKCDTFFFTRTFQYFNHQHKSFTFPHFVICMWNFLSLHNNGALAEWTFRSYFGGDECKPHSTASCDEVFHFMDIIYGISKEMDYNKHSEYREKQMHTGNSHEYDTKRAQAMVRGLAHDDKIGIDSFMELTKKSPALLNRVFSKQIHLRGNFGGELYWEKKSKKREGVSDFDHVQIAVLKQDASIFDMDPSKRKKDGMDDAERTKRHEQHEAAVKKVHQTGNGGNNIHLPHDHHDHQDHRHKTKMRGYNKSKYIAHVEHKEFTGRAHAEDHHHHAATKIQKILSRGHQGRENMRGHRAKKTGKLISKNWHEAYDVKKGKKYWHNQLTGENKWSKPKVNN